VTRFTWGIVIGVLALVGVALVLAYASPRAAAPPDLGTPEGVTLAFALALQSGDLDQAWTLLAPSAQAQTTKDRFITRAEGFRSTYQRARLSTNAPTVDGDTARVDLTRTYPSSGGLLGLGDSAYANTSTTRLAREGGQWRITTPPDPFLVQQVP